MHKNKDMKSYITKAFPLLLLLLTASCSDFLQEEDKDKVIPRTVEQYEAMMHQEAFLSVNWFYRSDFMTDDIEENALASTTAKNAYKSLYSWQRDVERDGSGTPTAATNCMWANLYSEILTANYVIEQSSDAEGTESERENIMGEAYFLRARAYLELVNIYAPVYDAATAGSTPGIPIRLGTGVKNDYPRNTLREVYRLIENDLNASIAHFERSNENLSLWHPNKRAALLLLSRVYLYEGQWEKVIETTSRLIELCPQGLYDLKLHPGQSFVTKTNPEILHTYGSCAVLIVETDGMGGRLFDVPNVYRSDVTVTYGISSEARSMYHEGDLRPALWFVASTSGKDVPAKWHSQFTQIGAYNYRLSEAYLSRAEAYAALDQATEAEADLRTVLKARVQDISSVTLPTSADELRRFAVDERRREFLGENHRWYDLRRTQSWYPKLITHVFTLRSSGSGSSAGVQQGKERYFLSSDSPNYTFEVPEGELEINGAVTPYDKRQEPAVIVDK